MSCIVDKYRDYFTPPEMKLTLFKIDLPFLAHVKIRKRRLENMYNWQKSLTVATWSISVLIYSVSQKSSPPKTFCNIFSPGEPV